MSSHIHDSIELVKSIDPAVVTADTNGTGVDLAGFEAAEIVFSIGESADTLSGSVYLELEVEDSPDNSVWTNCGAADLLDAEAAGLAATIDAAAEDDVVVKVGYVGGQRYVRPVINVTGTHTNGTPLAACVIKGKPRHAPTS